MLDFKQIRNFFLRAPSSTPASPTNGDIWYDATAGKFKKREGSVTKYLEVHDSEATIKIHQAFGTSIIAETQMCPYNSALAAVGLVASSIVFQPIQIDRPRTITGVICHQRTQGIYTAGAYNGVVLLSFNTGTGVATVVASSTDDGNIWKAAAGTFITKAFSSPYSITAGNEGVYLIGYLYTNSMQMTGPALAGFAVAGGTAAGAGAYPIFSRMSSASGVGSTYNLGSASNGVAMWGALY